MFKRPGQPAPSHQEHCRRSGQAGITTQKTIKGLLPALLAFCFMVLNGCGGSGGNGGSGSSQAPDPVAVDLPVAYVKRTLPLDDEGQPITENILDPAAFLPGAELFIRDRASSEAIETLITGTVFEEAALYDVKDLSVSHDGSKLIFAMRAPADEDLNEDEQPSWNIWEYDRSQDRLRRVIASNTTAESGQDVAPGYLADDRIVFSSTRQVRAKAILLDENKPQYEAQTEARTGGQNNSAFNLHVMDADGTDIQQISFNQSHDLYPTPLQDGRILYLRWDAVAGNNSLSFYSLLPDGSNSQFIYGFHSQNTGTNNAQTSFWSPRVQPDGLILAIQKQRQSESYGGDLVSVDIENFSEIQQPKPTSVSPETSAQKALSLLQVTTDGSPSPHGLFASAYPLYDGTERYLVSWSQCRLQDAALTQIVPCSEENLAAEDGVFGQAPPLYGLWMYNIAEDSQQPIIEPEEGLMYSSVAVMEPRPVPTFIQDFTPETELAEQQVALLNIRSVYDFDGLDTTPEGINAMKDPLQTAVDERPARFLRIEKAVSMPSDEVYDFVGSAFGAGGRGQLMREIIGYVQIEPDGSVLTKVPTDVALSLSVLNSEGKRISQRHEHWLHLNVGSTTHCSGCHTSNSEVAHGRADAEPESINSGAETTGLPFPNTNPALFADMGETMAETYARINGYRTPGVDLVFSDDWTDPGTQTPAESFAWLYSDLQTPAPVSVACQAEWNSLCRITINYPDHIQPIWDLDRPVFDAANVEISNNRCTTCHSEVDIDGLAQVPAAQLDLRSTPSVDNLNFMTSYQELFFQNDEQELDEDANLVFRLVESGNFETNEEGELILDEFGQPIPILVRVPVASILRANGAMASAAFFEPFSSGNSHFGHLSAAEQKLIAEWLDIGAQYYNNPFDAPEN